MSDPLIETLAEIVGAEHTLTDAALRAGYESDYTGRWSGPARAVVRPADTAQVAAVLAACAGAGAPVVTQGGNSGLVGGGVPRPDGSTILLSLRRMTRIDGVDTATAQLSAQAGATLADAQRAAREAGLDLALDLAARDSATLGGLVACDAGGVRALRHGTARRQLAGAEAVLADGSVIESRMSGLLKDTAGYDLGALLAGSEGTLAIITAVHWSLIGRRDARAVALVGLDSVAQAVELVARLRPTLPSLELCELMMRPGMALSIDHLGIAAPGPLGEVAVLLECATPTGSTDPLEELVEALDAAGVAERAISPADAQGRERLLAIRESHADAIQGQGVPVKFDVGVPLRRLAEFCERVEATIATVAPGARTIIFGHLGDGNLHVNVLGADDVDALEDAVLELVVDCDGTVSAEHGIGVHKVRHLALNRSDAELRAMRAIKGALDPAGILNPGVGLPPAE